MMCLQTSEQEINVAIRHKQACYFFVTYCHSNICVHSIMENVLIVMTSELNPMNENYLLIGQN